VLLLLVVTSAMSQPGSMPRVVPLPPPLLQAAGAERPIALQKATIEAEVVAGVVQSRIELVFHNPNARALEGELQLPLADGQQIVGFALDIDGVLREAVPVPKARGQQVFEAIARERVDPALLEQTAGNQFRLRIYPLPAGGTRRVQVSVRESLPLRDAAWHWRLPLQFIANAETVQLDLRSLQGVPQGPTAPVFKVTAQGGGRLSWSGSGAALAPTLQWSLPVPRQPQATQAVFKGECYLMAAIPVEGATVQRRLPRRVGLLWDASGSTAGRDRGAELAVLERYFAALGDGEVSLSVLRDVASPVRRFRVRNGDWQALRQTLLAEVADGGSGFSGWTPAPGVGEYLLVSDGHFNHGQTTLPALPTGQALYALGSAGEQADATVLGALAEARGGRYIAIDPDDVQGAATRLLAQRVHVEVEAGKGGRLQEPVIDEGALADGWLKVVARAHAPVQTLRLRLDGHPWQEIDVASGDAGAALLAGLWAQARLRQLSADPQGNRAAMMALSRDYNLVSSATSLLVLETLADYLRYGIRPAGALGAAYDSQFARTVVDRAAEQRKHLDAMAARWDERAQWWSKSYPKDDMPKKQSPDEALEARAPMAAPMAAPPAMAYLSPSPAIESATDDHAGFERIVVTGARTVDDALEINADDAGAANSGVLKVHLASWSPQSETGKRLRGSPPGMLYTRYLAERTANAGSSAFYLDVADLLLAQGQRDLALRVLSNLAELDIENRALLRVLGYRLLQADAPALAVPVFERVMVLAEEEPQSFRDLGLALAAAGRAQEALAALYQVVVGQWDARFNGVGLVALDELTALVARSGGRLDTSAIDPRLLRPMPLDLRVVLAWDSDDSDMDLWVIDPNGERAYYGNRETWQGGRMSADFTGGYGPEQFSLRDAKPGVYRIEADYFGSHEQVLTNGTTLMLRLSTGWGRADQQDKQITLRVEEGQDEVLVGEFVVR